MTFDLVKFLQPLTEPQGLLWLLFALLALRNFLKLRWFVAVGYVLLAALMSLVGATQIPAQLLASLERPYVREGLGGVPEADAVVVLGGTHRVSRYDAHGLNFGEGADRVMTGIELMRMGKAKAMLMGGGQALTSGGPRPEAEWIQRWAQAWKLTDVPVESLGSCTNTRDEAEQVARRYVERKWKRVLLVTSAYHLRRASAVFASAGIEVVPVGSDFIGLSALEQPPMFRIVPGLEGFIHLQIYLHEWVGYWYYRARGWTKLAAPAGSNDAVGR